MQKFSLSIEISISENWIEDGMNPKSKEFKESLEKVISERFFSYCYPNEFQVKVK
jgi:hypothetical protein